MFDFFVLHLGDIIVGLVLLGIVIVAIRSIFISRKRGACASCSYAKMCYGSNQKNFEQTLTPEQLKQLKEIEKLCLKQAAKNVNDFKNASEQDASGLSS